MKDLLTAFSPSLDCLAVSSGDGRIKIWDTVSGQLQTEFADITSNDALFNTKPERGHLSVDYKCMKWLSLNAKKKRKLGSSLLALGTGSGDVLALDVSTGQMKWSISDCHPGGVNAISFSTHDSYIYTAGADGMICKIDPQTGNILGKFRASTKVISCMSVSSDGKKLATASAQLKVFSCTDHKKLQKFSGHPGTVRCMTFTEDGKYILSSAVAERYVALWRTDGDKKQSASCVLAMEHPAVFLDSRGFETAGVDDSALYILAISESGVCYVWHGKDIRELRNAKPTKVSVSSEEHFYKNRKGALPTVLAAKLQGTAKPAGAAHVFIAHGLLVKPLFQKTLVLPAMDVKLSCSQDGVLLPVSQSLGKSNKGVDVQNRATALDRANAEDALRPLTKVTDFHEHKTRNDFNDSRHEADSMNKVSADEIVEADTGTTRMEEQLRLLNILGSKDHSAFGPTALKGIDLEANISQKKMKAAVFSMEPGNAYTLLEDLVAIWQSSLCTGKTVLPWIYSILVNHGYYIMDQEKPDTRMLKSIFKITKSRGMAVQPLLQLSGRLQLLTAQINKAAQTKTRMPLDNDQGEDNEEDDDDADEHLYGEEDGESQSSSDDDS